MKQLRISKHTPSIFQGKIAFRSSPAMSLTQEHPMERSLLRACILALSILACLYVYLVSASVLNVIAGKEASVDASRMASDVSELERTYFLASADIKPELAPSLGLVPVAHTAYVYRPGNAALAPAKARNEI